ncbi:MAG TPA: class I SAM-dependent rRNA methyltransferase [Saprospiraceae bacterium]|nr:class I SAM-dependent rRNA methyltransferase [Saprospiraceae bacterium]
MLPKIVLNNKKLEPVLRKHPWIFSGAIFSKDNNLADGDLVQVMDSRSNQLAIGHFYHGSIAVKILQFGSSHYSEELWYDKIAKAWNLRIGLNLLNSTNNCFRWIHGEGDGLPGLIVDFYNGLVVIQCHSIGMYRSLHLIKEAITKVAQSYIHTIVQKSKETLPTEFAKSVENSVLVGEQSKVTAIENGIKFIIDPIQGQKTGFFLDQRDNRQLVKQISTDRRILNTFCYTGGFSLYALQAGAKQVCSIDVSNKALELLGQNLDLNDLNKEYHESIVGDVLPFLTQLQEAKFDLIILDPPAFAKSVDKRHSAIQAYKRLNLLAMQKIAKPGILMSYSCSQVVTEELFYNTIVAAGIESGCEIKVLKKLMQGPDHPVSLFHPEGSYLKGLLLEIN